MALFKIAKGLAKDLPVKKTSGHCWLTTDDNKFYVDISDVERICINNIPTQLAQLLEDDQNRVITEGYFYNDGFYTDSNHTSLITPKSNKLYFDITTKKFYFYDGSAYVKATSALELGETETTAYRGDRGKTAYDHSQVTSGNPHQVTKSEVGLSEVANNKQVAVDTASQGLSSTEKTNAKTNIDLNNVTNNKQVAVDTASQGLTTTEKSNARTNINAMDASLKGSVNGVAELDANGKVPSSQLPSYVDDVVEYSSLSNFPITGETGKIYIAQDTNRTYRWSGTDYVEISASLALGETSSTAYRGDRGKTAYTHATDSDRLTTANNSGFYKISVTSEGHVGSVTSVSKSDITGLGLPGSDTTYTSETTSVGSASSWSAGSIPTLGTEIPADDITAWSTGTLPSLAVSEGTLYLNAGTLPSLSYTAKSIPNVTDVGTAPSLTITNTDVVTSITAN